jgi:hypothetical protein
MELPDGRMNAGAVPVRTGFAGMQKKPADGRSKFHQSRYDRAP